MNRFLSGILLSLSATMAHAETPTWAGSRVYAFEAGYVLDLNRGQSARPPKRSSEIVDCSDEHYFCVTEKTGPSVPIFQFVIPKRCTTPKVGTTWTIGSVRTTVIAFEAASGMYFIAPGAKSSVAYQWSPVSGINTIVVGRRGEDVAGQIAAVRGLPEHQLDNASALITFDELAGCTGR